MCIRENAHKLRDGVKYRLEHHLTAMNFTGTYTLREVIDDKNQISYQCSCLCDTNLFDVGVEGAGNCTNFVGCLGAINQGEGKVYVPGSKSLFRVIMIVVKKKFVMTINATLSGPVIAE